MRFQNPANGYIETSSAPFLWALLFGPFYFVLKGIWRHVVLYFAVNGILISVGGFVALVAGLAASSAAVAVAGSDPARWAWVIAFAPIVILLALVVPFLIYPFIASGIVRRHYWRMGWNEVDREGNLID